MMLRLASIGLGYGLLTLGVIGLIVPVLHGAIFIVTGLLVLSRHAAWAQRALDWLKRRHPRIERLVERGEGLVERGEQWLMLRLKPLFGRS